MTRLIQDRESGNDSDLSSVSSRYKDSSDSEVEHFEDSEVPLNSTHTTPSLSLVKMGTVRGRLSPQKADGMEDTRKEGSDDRFLSCEETPRPGKFVIIPSGRKLTMDSATKTDRAGRSILYRFVLANDIETVETLINTFEVNVNIRDNAGWVIFNFSLFFHFR
jgi:hypothetical protein